MDDDDVGALLRDLARALAPAGARVPADPRVFGLGEPRRTIALEDGLFAVVARGAEGLAIVERERGVLAAVWGRLPVSTPELLWVAEDRAVDLRRGVPGLVDPAALFRRVGVDRGFATAIGGEIGALLAVFHGLEIDDALAASLPRRVSWPEPSPLLRERLPRVIDDPPLLAAIDRALERLDAFDPPAADRRLVHSDVGLHNLAIDPTSLRLRGIFDFAEAALADRHWDLRHLLWSGPAEATFTAAVDAYEGAGGPPIERARVELYQAATAAGYLAYRDGVEPGRVWCGRTLAEDLAWTRQALAAIGEGPPDATA